MDKARILAQLRALQRISDELAGMIAALPDVEEKPLPPAPPPTGGEEREIMSARQVQEYLGIGESTFYTWIREGRLPPGEKWGAKMKRWRRTKILEWRASHAG